MIEAKNYYDLYHNNLLDICNQSSSNQVLLLDIHSYSDFQASKFSEGPFPDICIGCNETEIEEKILNEIINWCNEYNLSYKINFPYKGAIKPNGKLRDDLRIISIMLELNKKVYL